MIDFKILFIVLLLFSFETKHIIIYYINNSSCLVNVNKFSFKKDIVEYIWTNW